QSGSEQSTDSAIESAGCAGDTGWCTQQRALVYHREWSSARGTLRAQPQRLSRWRRTRAIYDYRSDGRTGLQSCSAELCGAGCESQYHLPRTDTDVWHGISRRHSRRDFAREPGAIAANQVGDGNWRSIKYIWKRWIGN